MKSPRLADHVLRLAKESGQRPEHLAVMAGASVAWIYLFLSGGVARPSCEFMQNLYEGLTGKPLIPSDSE